ncbi:hypothetical protein CH373_01625 [Leptospira perolatii]|uniref:SPOR domain-containing protein n=1 Tax=Leptospira perolatii TaxID=2023191 RepID=A0A2M9ZS16_9LEPT|nr:hypothetical protein [Leptospira perolatii]PJZ71236.1 hypothetical protein CH360_01625 [Leptospira perolatii]PJZ74769.1 hypothetical protein CH373_01625 [Leptospira perolatii]
MQNIDYSRKLKQSPNRAGTRNESQHTVQTIQHVRGSLSPIRSFPSSRSIFIVLIGAISIFTGGVVVGLRLDQKEQAFAQNETQSFYNTGKWKNSNSSESNADSGSAKSENLATAGQGNSGNSLKYPALESKDSYFISVPTSDSVEAMEAGKKLLRAHPEFQGRIFRSEQGELFVGYFYEKSEAVQALEAIRPLNDPVFHGSKLHKAKF